MGPGLGSLVIGFLGLSVAFGLLERRWPARAGQPRWRADSGTDLLYWFVTPLVTRAITRAALLMAVIGVAVLAGVPVDRAHIQAFLARPGGAVGAQPLALQVVEVVVLGDLIGYGMHRLFHTRWLWRFHAVHHSSTQLDWLSSVRLHPVNDVVTRLGQVVPLLLLGFRPGVVAAYAPFLTLHALLLHANVPWTFGPLRHVVSSPAFHRGHHAASAAGRNRNFGGLLPAWDLLFGTFHLPPGPPPEPLGIEGDPVPRGILAQLAHPFVRQP